MAMSKCPECGGDLSTRASKCIHCGCDIKACPECNTLVFVEAESCTTCGYPFDAIRKEESTKPPVAEPPKVQIKKEPTQSKETKNTEIQKDKNAVKRIYGSWDKIMAFTRIKNLLNNLSGHVVVAPILLIVIAFFHIIFRSNDWLPIFKIIYLIFGSVLPIIVTILGSFLVSVIFMISSIYFERSLLNAFAKANITIPEALSLAVQADSKLYFIGSIDLYINAEYYKRKPALRTAKFIFTTIYLLIFLPFFCLSLIGFAASTYSPAGTFLGALNTLVIALLTVLVVILIFAPLALIPIILHIVDAKRKDKWVANNIPDVYKTYRKFKNRWYEIFSL